jgi:hypothetical protein
MTPAVRQLVAISGILAAEHEKVAAELNAIKKPLPVDPSWPRTEKPRPQRDVIGEYLAEQDARTSTPEDILAARIASAAATETADVRPEAVAPRRLVPSAPSPEPAPPTVDVMKAHQDQQKEQARIRQQRKRARDRQKASREP